MSYRVVEAFSGRDVLRCDWSECFFPTLAQLHCYYCDAENDYTSKLVWGLHTSTVKSNLQVSMRDSPIVPCHGDQCVVIHVVKIRAGD